MCVVGSKLVIFGGRDSVGRKNDLFILDTGESKEIVPRHCKTFDATSALLHLHMNRKEQP